MSDPRYDSINIGVDVIYTAWTNIAYMSDTHDRDAQIIKALMNSLPKPTAEIGYR